MQLVSVIVAPWGTFDLRIFRVTSSLWPLLVADFDRAWVLAPKSIKPASIPTNTFIATPYVWVDHASATLNLWWAETLPYKGQTTACIDLTEPVSSECRGWWVRSDCSEHSELRWMPCCLNWNHAATKTTEGSPKLQNQGLGKWKMRFVLAALLFLAALSFVLVSSKNDNYTIHIGARTPPGEAGCRQIGVTNTDEGKPLGIYSCPA